MKKLTIDEFIERVKNKERVSRFEFEYDFKWNENNSKRLRDVLEKIEEANLEGANFEGANLKWANFEWANLKCVNFEWANLKWANFEGANLKYANLKCVNFEWANLKWANFEGANLKWANLKYANFEWANLEGANLKVKSSVGCIISFTSGEYEQAKQFIEGLKIKRC